MGSVIGWMRETMVAMAVLQALPLASIAIEFVDVPAPGGIANPSDTHLWYHGSVNYDYRMGKFEVTAGQYRDFLNAVARSDPYGLYNTYMDNDVVSGCQITRVGTSPSYSYDFSGRPVGTEADWANRPVNFVSWFDAARFANWMTTGNTESGVYNTTAWVAMDHPLAAATYGTAYFLPTEDEWYKAAYYDPNKPGGAGYWDYPTRSDSVPTWEPPPGGANSANYFDVTTADYAIGGPYYRNTVGAYVASRSPYGTYDQGGNVYEWNETESTAHRGIRGGSFSYYPSYMNAGVRNFGDPAFENDDNLGFRIASISAVIPEPGSLVLMVLAAAGAARHRKHRAP